MLLLPIGTETVSTVREMNLWISILTTAIASIVVTTRPYFCHIDAKGTVSKAFMLPQRNPRRFYRERFFSLNVPDFIIAPTHLDTYKACRIINDEYRKSFGVRKEPAL